MIAELETFIAASRHEAFAASDGHIGLTRSAVSSQMRRIEDHLGFPLSGRTVLERAELCRCPTASARYRRASTSCSARSGCSCAGARPARRPDEMDYLANSEPRSANDFISMALPDGSRKNIVACSPGSPLKRM